MKYYYYIYKTMGYTSSMSFSHDSTRWIRFSEEDITRVNSHAPYGCHKAGQYVECSKYNR
jgi:hypothetical protein